MFTHPTGLVCALILAIPAVAAPSPADDDVLAGYRRYHAGDKEGAQHDFERLVSARPAALPARFGLLQILEDRSRETRALEAEFEKRMEPFLADAETRHTRSETDDEALFYLANGHWLRAMYRLNHNKGVWGAARDGVRSKRLTEAYLKRHPEHGDAYFALGTYNYYVEIAPAFIRVIRLFLFLPAGDRPEGLKQIERAHTQGSLFAFQAGLMLMEIYGSFEGRPADGVRIGERLAGEFPDNPAVQFALAQLYLSPAVEDYVRAGDQYQAIIAREERRAVARPAKYQAQLGLASALFQQWRIEESIGVLSAMIEAKPDAPSWVLPAFLLRRANYRALAGDAAAADDVRRVLAEPRWKDRHKAADDLQKWMERRRASGEVAIYAALIRGNRLAAERRWDDAAAAYEAVRRDHPDDPQVRYRIAELQFTRGEIDRAVSVFSAIAADPKVPDWIKAQALLYLGRAHDLAGRRADAKKTYERIVDDYEREGAARAARVGLVTPYRRR
jgi:tetratricopeptide (TPR) repeat protein